MDREIAVTQDVSGDDGAQMVLVVEQSFAESLARYRESVSRCHGDLDVELESDGNRVKSRPQIGRTGRDAREHDVSVGVARGRAVQPCVRPRGQIDGSLHRARPAIRRVDLDARSSTDASSPRST